MMLGVFTRKYLAEHEPAKTIRDPGPSPEAITGALFDLIERSMWCELFPVASPPTAEGEEILAALRVLRAGHPDVADKVNVMLADNGFFGFI